MAKWRRMLLLPAAIVMGWAAMGCDGAVRFKFMRYPETPVVLTATSGLSSAELAGIIAAIR